MPLVMGAERKEGEKCLETGRGGVGGSVGSWIEDEEGVE